MSSKAMAIVAGWGSGVFSIPATGLVYPWCALGWVAFAWLMAWGSVLAYSHTSRELAKDVAKNSPMSSMMTDRDSKPWNYRLSSVLFIVATVLFCLFFIVPLQGKLLTENRVLTYWRAMHLTSGVSPLVPIFLFLIGLYLSFWFTLHEDRFIELPGGGVHTSCVGRDDIAFSQSVDGD